MKAPAAILFDYGGVVTDVRRVDAGFPDVARSIANLLASQGLDTLTLDDIEADLRAGNEAYESWKQSQSRRMRPRELSHTEFWELVTCDWPAAERDAVFAQASQLCEEFEFATLYRPAKPDARNVLVALREREIRTALVCNCLAGDSARHQMRNDRLDDLFDVVLFSDEVGVRKPNPEFVRRALEAVGVRAADAWFVGDKLNRDILGARRGGVGKAILMSSTAGAGRPVRGVEPDVVVDSLTELLDLLA